jgi:hypothetical protein
MIDIKDVEEGNFYWVKIKGKVKLQRLGVKAKGKEVVSLTPAWNYVSDTYANEDVEFIEES